MSHTKNLLTRQTQTLTIIAQRYFLVSHGTHQSYFIPLTKCFSVFNQIFDFNLYVVNYSCNTLDEGNSKYMIKTLGSCTILVTKHHLLGKHIPFILQTYASQNNSATELCCKDSYQCQILSLRSYTGKSLRMQNIFPKSPILAQATEKNHKQTMQCQSSACRLFNLWDPGITSVFKKLSTKSQLGKTYSSHSLLPNH